MQVNVTNFDGVGKFGIKLGDGDWFWRKLMDAGKLLQEFLKIPVHLNQFFFRKFR